MTTRFAAVWRVTKVAVLSAAVVGAIGAGAWMAYSTPPLTVGSPTQEPVRQEKISRLDADRFCVPDSVCNRLKLKTAVVATAHACPFAPFQGCLALDNNSLQRVHSRFSGEVVELGSATVPQAGSVSTQASLLFTRLLQVGDTVKAGQILAVVWSKDLGEKKSELVEAVSKLKSDEKVFERLTELYKQGGTAERSLRDAERTVQSDKVAVDRAERTLKSWRLTDAEVALVKSEVEKLSDASASRIDSASWARVDVRAARDGTILEKNLTVGDLVDTTTDLFKIGDLTSLTVWAHAYEDDLPALADLPKPIQWTVTLPARPGVLFRGTLEQIGAVIDPNQHTALVSGHVGNPGGELKVGQFVTVTASRPVHPGEFVVPTEAVVEDGRQSVVFVRPDPSKPEYVRRPVTVARRTRDEIFLAVGSQVQLHENVVTAGVLLLREAADALPAVH